MLWTSQSVNGNRFFKAADVDLALGMESQAGVAADRVADGGLVVLETDARTEPELPLPVRTSRKYGNTRVTIFGASL